MARPAKTAYPIFIVKPLTDNAPLNCIYIVISGRDEEGCIAPMIEDLHMELKSHGIPHEDNSRR
jgi:hypothetical protein